MQKTSKPVRDLIATRNILDLNISLFHKGNIDLYRVVATELRKLLCDGDNSLLPRLFPDAKFHQILGGHLSANEMNGLVFRSPGVIEFNGKGGSKIIQLFDNNLPYIDLNTWLSQPLLSPQITILELIRSVADKESAHSDPKYNETLKITNSIYLVDKEIHIQYMVIIGEYILEWIKYTIDIVPGLKEIAKSFNPEK